MRSKCSECLCHGSIAGEDTAETSAVRHSGSKDPGSVNTISRRQVGNQSSNKTLIIDVGCYAYSRRITLPLVLFHVSRDMYDTSSQNVPKHPEDRW